MSMPAPFAGPPFALTMGDPAGIGPEIVARLAADENRPALPFVVIGDLRILRRAAAIVGADLDFHAVDERLILPPATPGRPALAVLQAGPDLPDDLPFGIVDARAGAAAFAYVQRAIDLALARKVSGIVTAPISKEAMRAAGISYPGHTEILADRAGTTDFAMMLANEELRVLLVSIHVSLVEAIAAVTLENELRAIRLADGACRSFGVAAPRVAVAGLNPHAGENGLFGREDLDVIAPAVAAARREGIDASGPWPGDTVFMRARQGAFDIVVAQYHDQGLIPVKYLGLDNGTNVTVGLPFIRTSVDHGTAFDIAGTGRAEHASLALALVQAGALARAAPGARPDRIRRGRAPDFIFMLTRQDRTVEDALARLAEVLAAGVRRIGFKDVGLPFGDLSALADAIRSAGAEVYLEVVSLDEASEVASARTAVGLGVDVLMGGTRPDAVLPVIAGTPIRYFPFPGRIVGHPSVLEGTHEEIVASAERLAAREGVHGLDLLAYRYGGDVPALIARVCAAVEKPVVVAGSIDCADRIGAVVAGGAAAFTIGTAALDGAFPAAEAGLTAQLRTVYGMLSAACREEAA